MNDFIKLHHGGQLMLLRRSLIQAAYKLDYSDGSACTTVECSNAGRWIVDETPEQIWEMLSPRINRQENAPKPLGPVTTDPDCLYPRAPKVTC